MKKEEVDNNPQTPIDILLLLANDQNVPVQQGIANNTTTSVSLLESLSSDENKDIREQGLKD